MCRNTLEASLILKRRGGAVLQQLQTSNQEKVPRQRGGGSAQKVHNPAAVCHAPARLTALSRSCQGHSFRLPASPGVTHFLLEKALEDSTDPLSLQGVPCPNHLQSGWNHRATPTWSHS